MSDKVFDVVLLNALPASGKSEVRNFMANIDPEVLKRDFHIGENLQLDDFPYVHFMRRIDDELEKMGYPRIFYQSTEKSFINDWDWGTLIQLLNDDFLDLINRNVIKPDSVARYLFNRIDNAALRTGIPNRLGILPEELIVKLSEVLEEDANAILEGKLKEYPEDFTDKTIVIESARGGHDGASCPLEDPFGYQYSLRQYCPELLSRAVILYIWVTPEESRRKNFERANPDDPGSNLFHGVPLSVMLNDYGTDDMAYLIENSEVEDTVTVKAHGNTYHLPIGVFDNRVDQTSFLRKDKSEWTEKEISEMTESIQKATDAMFKNYKK